MPRPLSIAFRRNSNDPQTNVAFFALLTIRYEPTDTTYRVVNNNEDVNSRGKVFTAYGFELSLPIESGEQIGVASLTIDNVDQLLIDMLRAATEAPRIDIEIVLSNSPDYVELSVLDLALRDVSWDATTITAQLYNEDFLSQAYPSFVYNPAEYAGLFG